MDGRGKMVRIVLGSVMVAAAAALLLSGCSDALYPAVHDMPAPRADTPLTPDQVKQATDSLISDRDHLSTELQAAQPPAAPNAAANASSNKPMPTPNKPPPAQTGASGAAQTAAATPSQ